MIFGRCECENQDWHAELKFPPINRTYRASDETYTLR